MKNTIKLFASFAIVFAVFACADDTTNKTSTQELVTGATTLTGTEWVLTDYKNTPLDQSLRNRSTLKFSAGPSDNLVIVSGRSFINSYNGTMEIDEKGNVSSPEGFMATKMGGSILDMQAEVFYFQKLGEVTSMEVDNNDQLILYFGDEEVGYFTRK